MHESMRVVSLVALVLSTAGVASADNGWARYTRTLTTGVQGCVDAANRMFRVMTSDAPQTVRVDPYTAGVHAYIGSEVVFVQCAAAPVRLCGLPQANMTLLVLSDTTSLSALETLQEVDAAIGNPHRIDCGPAGEGL